MTPEPPFDSTATRVPDAPGAGTVTYSGGPSVRPLPGDLPDVPGYALLAELGRGGMGVVYRARDPKLNRDVALKMVLGGSVAGPAAVIRFLAEAKALAALHHPNVVQVFDRGEHRGLPFYTMEFCPGGSLGARVKDNPLAGREAAELVERLARGVAAAHAVGILHRDLKPENVLFAADGTPKLTDFGLAKRFDDSGASGPSSPALTLTGVVMGTPSYMAPEQARGETKGVGPAVDVYALGALLYRLVTGRPPFLGANAAETLRQVIDDEPVSPMQLTPGLPRDLATICLKCLAKEPGKRYAGATEVADDLRRYLDGRTILARPVGPVERAVKWVRRNPVITGSTLAVVLVLAAGTVVSYVKYREAEAARRAEADRVRERDDAIAEAAAALANEAERVNERDAALADARYQLGVSNFLLAATAYERRDARTTRERLDQVPTGQRKWEWLHLLRQSEGGIYTFRGHSDGILAVGFSPDGGRVVTGSRDRTAKVWDVRTGAVLLDLNGHANAVTCAAFSPDGGRIVTGSYDRTAKVWDARTGRLLDTLRGHTDAVVCAAFSPDGGRVVTGSYDRTAKVWHARSGRLLNTLTRQPAGQKASVSCVAFSPDGTRLAIGSGDRTTIWDADSFRPLFELNGRTHYVLGLGFSPDGSRLVTGGVTVSVWDAQTGRLEYDLVGHPDRVTCATFSPDGGRIVTGSANGAAQVWDARTRTVLLDLTGHTLGVTAATFSPDGGLVVTGSDDGTARVWDAGTGRPVLTAASGGSIEGAAFSPDGRRFLTGGVASHQLWDAETGQRLLQFGLHGRPVSGVAFSPDGERVVSGSHDGTARVWDARTGIELMELEGHASLVRAVAFSPDGDRVATGELDGSCRVWNARTGRQIHRIDVQGWVDGLAWSPDGTSIATALRDRTVVCVWDAGTGRVLRNLEGHTLGVNSVAFTRDGARLVSGSDDRTVKVWDVRTGHLVADLRGHTAEVRSVAVTPDGDRVISGGDDVSVRVWDVRTGTPLLTLHGPVGMIKCVAISPDGTRVLAGDSTGTARVWDVSRIPGTVDPPLPIEGGVNPVTLRSAEISDPPLPVGGGPPARRLPPGVPFEDLWDRVVWTRPSIPAHREHLRVATALREWRRVAFYLDRLLSAAPAARPDLLAERARALPGNTVLRARTAVHSPRTVKADPGPLALRAAHGDLLAVRLVGGLLLRKGDPDKAIAPLTVALALRAPDRPPVEELLLALAHAKAGRPNEAKALHAKAVGWLDRYRRAMQAASALGTASTAGWGGAFELFRDQADPRYNPFDWETWYECQVFRAEVEGLLAKK